MHFIKREFDCFLLFLAHKDIPLIIGLFGAQSMTLNRSHTARKVQEAELQVVGGFESRELLVEVCVCVCACVRVSVCVCGHSIAYRTAPLSRQCRARLLCACCLVLSCDAGDKVVQTLTLSLPPSLPSSFSPLFSTFLSSSLSLPRRPQETEARGMYSLSLAEVEVQTRGTSLSITIDLDFKFNSSWNPNSAPPTALAPIIESRDGAGAVARTVVEVKPTAGSSVGTADSASVTVPPVHVEGNPVQGPPSSVPSADSAAEAGSSVPLEQSADYDVTNPASTGNSVQVTHDTQGQT
jgi:hypothetical protein